MLSSRDENIRYFKIVVLCVALWIVKVKQSGSRQYKVKESTKIYLIFALWIKLPLSGIFVRIWWFMLTG